MEVSYKLYQLLSFFVTKFSYKIIPVDNSRPNEVFLVGSIDRKYPLIRLTTNSIEQVTFEKERLDETISFIFNRLRIKDGRFLDIHIGRDEILDEEIYDSIAIDIDYYSGPDLNDYYPGIHKVIHEVSDATAEINSILFDLRMVNDNARAQRRAIKKSEGKKPIATYIIIAICVFMYALYMLLQRNYSDVNALVALGANYKTFTIGLYQLWRLITAGFLHSSFFHLLFNMLSLFSLGRVMETTMGTRKYLIVLFGSLIVSSMTSLAFNDNTITVGLSGGLYGLFAFYMITGFYGHTLNSAAAMQVIIINLFINFLGGVDIMGHVGGFIAGIVLYFAMNNKKAYIIYLCLLVALVWRLFFYDTTYSMYGGTDLSVIEIYEDLGLDGYADKLKEQIVEVWRKNS